MTERTFDQLKAADLLRRGTCQVSPCDEVRIALELARERRLMTLPVVDSRGRCTGVVRYVDLVEAVRGLTHRPASGEPDRVSFFDRAETCWNEAKVISLPHADLEVLHVEDVVSSEATLVSDDTPLRTIARIMVEKGVSETQVVDHEERFLGVISLFDLARLIWGVE